MTATCRVARTSRTSRRSARARSESSPCACSRSLSAQRVDCACDDALSSQSSQSARSSSRVRKKRVTPMTSACAPRSLMAAEPAPSLKVRIGRGELRKATASWQGIPLRRCASPMTVSPQSCQSAMGVGNGRGGCTISGSFADADVPVSCPGNSVSASLLDIGLTNGCCADVLVSVATATASATSAT